MLHATTYITRLLCSLTAVGLSLVLHAQTVSSDSLLRFCERLETTINNGGGSDFVRDIEELKQIELSEQVATMPDTVALRIGQTLALYHQNVDTDFPSALSYGFKALEVAQRMQSPAAESATLSLISSIYFLKNDTIGLSYARESYNISRRLGYDKSIYTSSCNIANFLFNLERYDEAMEYLQAAFELAQQRGNRSELQYLYSFLGDVYNRQGDNRQAEHYYRLSVVDLDETTQYDKLYARICYSLYLARTHHNDEALALLNEVELKAHEWNITTFDREIYSNRADIYEQMHRYAEALADHKRMVAEKERLVNDEKEKAVRILELKYEVAREQEKNALQQVELLEKDRRALLIAGLSLLLLVSAIFLWILNQRQRRRYEEIVRQQLEMLEASERQHALALQHIQERQEAARTAPSPNLTTRSGQDLCEQLEQMMLRDKAYCDPLLSIDKLAEMLDTNRTYLSKVINEQFQTSYSNYINRLRLEEAIRRLSNPQDETSMKDLAPMIGFNSLSSFYTLFKKRYGITPTLYRENVKRMAT